MIRASCHTADNARAVEFDATPWFREADPQSILHLAEQGWSSVFVADALEARPGYEGLHRLVEYAATRLQGGVARGPHLGDLRLCCQPAGCRTVVGGEPAGDRSQALLLTNAATSPWCRAQKLLAQIAPAETRSLRCPSYVGSVMLQPAPHAPWLRVRTTSLGWGASLAEPSSNKHDCSRSRPRASILSSEP
jgi:hypothetical protein